MERRAEDGYSPHRPRGLFHLEKETYQVKNFLQYLLDFYKTCPKNALKVADKDSCRQLSLAAEHFLKILLKSVHNQIMFLDKAIYRD